MMTRLPNRSVIHPLLCFPIVIGALLTEPATADPVTDFIMRADSIASAGDDDGLARFVQDRDVLVGAAVAQLLDVAFDVEREGNVSGAAENVAFAKRIAANHQAAGRSPVPLALVDTYDGWAGAQREVRAQAMALESRSTEARGAGELDRAAELLDQARALYEQIGDRHSVAVNWGSRGVVHWYTGDMDLVIADYTNALQARREVDDNILVGRTLNGLGSAHRQKGDYAAAIGWYEQAIDMRRRTGDLAGLGTSLTYLGNVYYLTGRLALARDYYEEALPILEAQGNGTQMFDIVNSIAALYDDMGRYGAARDAYLRALAVAIEIEDPGRIITSRVNLADSYRRQGLYSRSMEQLNEIHAVLETHPDSLYTAITHRDRGRVYRSMGELDSAREDFLAYAEMSEALPDPAYHIEALIEIGRLYFELGAYDRGLKIADDARARSEAAGNARHYRESIALAASLLGADGRYEESLERWNLALEQDEYDQAEANVLQDKVGIATQLAGLGRNDEARAMIHTMLPDVEASGVKSIHWSAYLALGHSFERENPDSAAFYYERALALVESAGASASGTELQTDFLSGERRFFYEEVARFYASQAAADDGTEWLERSFRTIERAKARGLLSMMERSLAGSSSPEEDEVLDVLYALDPLASDYAERKRELETRYVEMRRARMDETLGDLTAVTTVADVGIVQKTLPKKTILIEYALGDTTSLMWALDGKNLHYYRLPTRAEIERDVRELRDAIARPGDGDAALLRGARSLYVSLLAPAEDAIDGAKNVVIVPDGVLFELPFEILLTDEPDGAASWREQPFFAHRAATTYAPSATVFTALCRKKHSKGDYHVDLLAVGNPDFSGVAERDLAPLPHAGNEVELISARVKEKKRIVLMGSDASEAAVKRCLEDDAPRVVHFATHGLVDPAEPARSSVVLAVDGDNTEDGQLFTLEILSLSAEPALVVMSACESARGKVSRGEGVVGLSRAFIATGADGVVASLWSVSDESTAELMKNFYDRMLGKKRPAGRALNEARLDLIASDRYSHPFYWSPFVVTGSVRSPW